MSQIHFLVQDDRYEAAANQATKEVAVYKLNNPNEPEWVYEEEFSNLYARVLRNSGPEIKYLPGDDEVIFEWHPLWWHSKGLTQTASGYGSKLNTGFKIRFNGLLYRVYCCQWSNIGTAYIISKGVRLVIPNHRVFIQIGGQTSLPEAKPSKD